MASFRKRNGKWQVQVRSKSAGSRSATFTRKVDAQKWAADQEISLQNGAWNKVSISGLTIENLLEKYRLTVTPHKKGAKTEDRRLRRLLRDNQIRHVKLSHAQPHIFAQFRDARLTNGVRASQYDLILLKHAWNIARLEWGWDLAENPVSLVRMPKNNPPRERRLTSQEFEDLRLSLLKSRNTELWSITELAIETAMRRSEILALEWPNIDLKNRLAFIPNSKNGSSRRVPLTNRAVQILSGNQVKEGDVFKSSENAFRLGWHRAIKRAQIADLHFHDLRHEAISRMFENKMTVAEVASISGHKDPRTLMRYSHLAPSRTAY